MRAIFQWDTPARDDGPVSMYKWGSNSCSHVVWQLGEAALQKDFLDFDIFLVKNRLSRSWHLIFHQLWVVHSLSLAFVELCDPNFTDAVVCHPRWGELRWFQHLEIQGYGGLEIISLGLWGCWRWWFYHVLEVFFKENRQKANRYYRNLHPNASNRI